MISFKSSFESAYRLLCRRLPVYSTLCPSANRKKSVCDDEGATLVETAISSVVLIALLFGFFQLSMALYSYHFVSEAAREASRFAMVRGSQCPININASYCSPYAASTKGAQSSDISNYVNSLGYPFAGKLSATTTWLTKAQDSNGYDIWTTCSGSNCNDPFDHEVQVTVSYAYPLVVPFLQPITINMSSKSAMVISQ